MKLDKILCYIFFISFLALAVYKPQQSSKCFGATDHQKRS